MLELKEISLEEMIAVEGGQNMAFEDGSKKTPQPETPSTHGSAITGSPRK